MFMWNGLDEEGKGYEMENVSHQFIRFSRLLIIWMLSIYLRVHVFIWWIEGNIIWVWSIHLRCCVITLESVHYSFHLSIIKSLFRCVPMVAIVVLSLHVIVNRNALEDAIVGLMQRRIQMLSNVTDWEDPMLRWNWQYQGWMNYLRVFRSSRFERFQCMQHTSISVISPFHFSSNTHSSEGKNST